MDAPGDGQDLDQGRQNNQQGTHRLAGKVHQRQRGRLAERGQGKDEQRCPNRPQAGVTDRQNHDGRRQRETVQRPLTGDVDRTAVDDRAGQMLVCRQSAAETLDGALDERHKPFPFGQPRFRQRDHHAGGAPVWPDQVPAEPPSCRLGCRPARVETGLQQALLAGQCHRHC